MCALCHRERVLEVLSVGHEVGDAPLLSLFHEPWVIDLRLSCNRHGGRQDPGFLKCGHCTCEAVRPLMVVAGRQCGVDDS